MKSILLAILLSCLLVSCDYSSNTITLESNSLPLTFKLHGSAKVQWIWIQGPYQNIREPAPKLPAPDDPKKIIVWQIMPARDFLPLDETPQITYGQLPDGWRQERPKTESPPPLLDGYVYLVDAVLVRGTIGALCVYVKDGQLHPHVDDDPTSRCK